MGLKEEIDIEKLPRHIAIIMDGNGRWAKDKGEDRLFGHFHGVESVRNIVEGCAELGVQYLTLYAFSTENWDRPKDEVNALMSLLVSAIIQETDNLNEKNVRMLAIGDLGSLPSNAQTELAEAIKTTSLN